jgi:hypothetical protein
VIQPLSSARVAASTSVPPMSGAENRISGADSDTDSDTDSSPPGPGRPGRAVAPSPARRPAAPTGRQCSPHGPTRPPPRPCPGPAGTSRPDERAGSGSGRHDPGPALADRRGAE